MEDCLLHIVVNDILVNGEGKTEEKQSLTITENYEHWWTDDGLVLNKDKLWLRQKEMRVIGQILTEIGLKPGPERMKAVEEMPTPN